MTRVSVIYWTSSMLSQHHLLSSVILLKTVCLVGQSPIETSGKEENDKSNSEVQVP